MQLWWAISDFFKKYLKILLSLKFWVVVYINIAYWFTVFTMSSEISKWYFVHLLSICLLNTIDKTNQIQNKSKSVLKIIKRCWFFLFSELVANHAYIFIGCTPFSNRFELIDASVNLLNGPEKCYSDFMLIRSRLIVNRLQKASSKDDYFFFIGFQF